MSRIPSEGRRAMNGARKTRERAGSPNQGAAVPVRCDDGQVCESAIAQVPVTSNATTRPEIAQLLGI